MKKKRTSQMEAAHVLRKTAVKKPLATCLSMSLAVLNVATLADTDAAACQNRTLSTYDQLCSPGEALTVVDKDSAGGVHRRIGNTTQFYENEESVLEKVQIHIKGGVRAFRLFKSSETFLVASLQLFAVQSMFPLKCMATFHSDYEDFGGSCVRNSPFSRLQEIAKVIGALVCMVSPHFTAMKTFPVDNCDYLVYMDGTSDIRDEWSQPGTQAAFRTFLSFRKQPGLRLAVAFSIGPDDPALGLPAAVDLFKSLTAWLVRERLNGLAFVTPAATPALCERLLVFVNVSTSLAMEAFLDAPRAPTMCFSLNFAGLEFLVRANRTNLGSPCEREQWVDYSKTCPRSGVVEGVFADSKTMVQFSEETVWTFEDEHTMASKLTWFLERNPSTCVAAFHLDHEDAEGSCRPPFSRLRKLRNVLGVNHERVDVGGEGPRNSSLARTPLSGSGKVDSTVDRRALICVFSESATYAHHFPARLCHSLVYTSVHYEPQDRRLAIGDEPAFWRFVETAQRASPPPWMLVAVRPDSFEERARAFAYALTIFLQDKLMDGVVLFSDADPTSIVRLTKVVSDHFRRAAKAGLKIMLGVPQLEELTDIARFSDFVIVAPQLFANRARCTVLAPSPRPLSDKDYAVLTLSAQACPRNDVEAVTDKNWLVSYRDNGTAVEIFEDEATLELKVGQLSSGHPDGCLAAFSVDLEDSLGSCRQFRRAFSRLQLLSDLLRAPQGTLVCVMASIPKGDFPVELCNYVIYDAVSFDTTRNTVVASNGEDLGSFLLMTRRSAAIAAVALDPSSLEPAGTSNRTALRKRAGALGSWLREVSLPALALFSAPYADSMSYGRLVRELWQLLRKPMDFRIGLIAGVHFDYSRAPNLLNSLSRISDVLILLSHRTLEAPYCTVEAPSQFNFDSGDFRFMVSRGIGPRSSVSQLGSSLQKSVGDSSKCQVCLSLNLGVTSFRVRSPRAVLGEACLQRQLVGFGQVRSFSRVYPSGCVAAVQVDLEDWSGECAQQPRFSRLRELASLLRAPDKGPPRSEGRKTPEDVASKKFLVCEFAGKRLPSGFPRKLCTHLVYLGADYEPSTARIITGPAIEDFLRASRQSGEPRLLAAFEPGVLSTLDTRKSTLVNTFLKKLASWMTQRQLGGLALISSLVTDMTNLLRLTQRDITAGSHGAVPCLSFNMAVEEYKLMSAESSFGSSCTSSKWLNYDRTCPTMGLRMERDVDWMTAYARKDSEMLVFEDEASINRKMEAFLRVNPGGCVAAFNVLFEDFAGRCASRERYSRLQLMSNKLRSRSGEVRKRKFNMTTEQSLVCVTLSEVANPQLIGRLCSHVVYWGVAYNPQEGTLKPEGQSWRTFMTIEKAKLLIGLEPKSTNSIDVQNTLAVEQMLRHMLDWTAREHIAGIALFSTALSDVDKLLHLTTTCPDFGINYSKLVVTGLSFRMNNTAIRIFENQDSIQKLVSRFLGIHWTGCVSLFGADKDDLGGRCLGQGPAPRIRLVSGLLSGSPGGFPTTSEGSPEKLQTLFPCSRRLLEP
ncbi:hypothetical protein IscW_ISCW018694 [Ixodes scapularis]|uniref:Uncharacterized protein n=1 Tax=Ixodes scapularis TaxID=6945 RepID=B7PNQ4_IXOSC|nr:hypothetical protein IscW_ISCW018694 [Ixodes scapularis]|eukprot:XP_002435396.1 hypothetical protein IscW_ISCW018694 [Ixodes scapularis]